METEGAKRLIAAGNWFHSYEVLPGIISPGRAPTDARETLNTRYRNLPENLEGKTALDIGALDGPYSFELERRGANVTALDIQNPDHTGFSIAKRVRQSTVKYIQGSAYELHKLTAERFDIITFFGVWYHMKHPLLAFEQISHALKSDGLLMFEGECLLNHAEIDGIPQPALADIAGSPIPLCAFYPKTYKGSADNWFVPNAACVKAWVDASGLEITSHGFLSDYPHQRMYGSAAKRPGAVILPDNPVW